ncbi:MarR family winged helix-turn-helix transcriptional regulator [Wenyingzhuangia sp. IMCC45533]
MGAFSKEVNTKFPSEEVKTMLNIRYTANYLSNLGAHILKPFEISNAQYNILRILRGADQPITMKVVKERMIEKSPNTTRLTDKLCNKQLVERVKSDDDKRAIYISITQKGLEILQHISFDLLNSKLSRLTTQEQQALNKLLDKIRD